MGLSDYRPPDTEGADSRPARATLRTLSDLGMLPATDSVDYPSVMRSSSKKNTRAASRLGIWSAVAGVLLSACAGPPKESVRVAVASNFADAAGAIADRFEAETGLSVGLSFGSTGKHYAQIVNGAPFDVFLGADIEHPRRLEEAGVGVPSSRFTYARGRLVLWSPIPDLVDPDGRVLGTSAFRFLAIANPDLAPFGRAAREVLEARGLWQVLAERIVRGENVAQSYQFVQSGNAELGFVASSQIVRSGTSASGSVWIVPDSLYTPIDQQALILTDSEGARLFAAFLRRPEIRELIRTYGHETP